MHVDDLQTPFPNPVTKIAMGIKTSNYWTCVNDYDVHAGLIVWLHSSPVPW